MLDGMLDVGGSVSTLVPLHSPLHPACIREYKIAVKEPRLTQCRSSANAAFSLIELLVVLALALVVFTLYWNHGPSKRDRELTACRLNLEKIYLAMQIYSRDFSDKYPVSTNAVTSEDALALLVPRYDSDTSVFICPATSEPSTLPAGKSFRDWKISYAYYMGRRASETDKVLLSDAQINTDSKSVGATVFSETGKPPGNNHGKGGGNFMTGDGRVVSSTRNARFSIPVQPPVILLNPKP
jgi:prepilin-type N-terminal cleavage/methylation domain-containing protein